MSLSRKSLRMFSSKEKIVHAGQVCCLRSAVRIPYIPEHRLPQGRKHQEPQRRVHNIPHLKNGLVATELRRF